jgi:hypothetical protein
MKRRYAVALALCLCVAGLVGAVPAHAAGAYSPPGALLAVQRAELASPDTAADTYFGWAVAISGNTAIVGEVGADAWRGAAYVFVRRGGTWSQQAELTASDGAAGDAFGFDVAISGKTALVGACGHSVGGDGGQGAVYVFVRRGATWIQQAELSAADGAYADGFGYTIATSGDTAVVAANGHMVGGNAGQGAVYVFVRHGATWSQQAELTASDGVAGDQFGFDVAIWGDTVVAGAALHPVGGNADRGAAYVFVRHGATWSQQAEFTPADGAGGYFGYSVAISGHTVVVGVPASTVGGNEYQGSADVFARHGPTWTQQAELTAADGGGGDFFGSAVAVVGSNAVIGAVGRNNGQGAAYVFVRGCRAWSQRDELTAGGAGDNFGNVQGIAISGDRVLIAAPGHTVDDTANVGAVYVYARCRHH